MNSLRKLADHGQSVWLDYIRRSLITSGELRNLINQDGLQGVTSNPAIFGKAIATSNDYAEALEELLREKQHDAKALYEKLAVEDIKLAADELAPVFEATRHRDGYVSLEVAPDLAHDTKGTIAEARQLWKAVGRPNAMIKVPATEEGLPAIEQLVSDGININVTLLFAREMYERVTEAYMSGLERLADSGGDVSKVASVASFFISRIDSAIDAQLAERLEAATDASARRELRSLMGGIAIANAKLTYQRYKEIFSGARWDELAKKGAQTQRLLWASTSTKDPEYRDVLYVEELIGPDTVNTIPPATYDAFREHGQLRASLEEGVSESRELLERLDRHGVSLQETTDKLLTEGVGKFAEAFAELLSAVAESCRAPAEALAGKQNYDLPAELAAAVEAELEEWQRGAKVRRLWARDAKLWTGTDESDWLGWLGITEDQLKDHLPRFDRISAVVKERGYAHALLLGMGGSSLCPEVLEMTFGKMTGFPELHVLDSTDPAQVKTFEDKVDLERTLFIVASKSGTTLEPNAFMQYFHERAKERVGARQAGHQFIAITDPGSKLEAVAEDLGFRRVFHGVPSIGGRYSALSDFGMVPAAVMGLDVRRLLDRADDMVQACAACVPAEENPGLVLGVILGVLGRVGRNKITLIASPGVWDLGAWLEQLVAESTGKDGLALIPVDGERLGPPGVYGDDRLFVYLRLSVEADADQDAAIDRLRESGQPVVRIEIDDRYDVAQEFFRWEFATAVAGSILGINPFNQPDVEASKVATRALTAEFEEKGSLPAETPMVAGDGLELYADEENAADLSAAAGVDESVAAHLRAHLDRLREGDYLGLLAYVEMNEPHIEELQTIRHRVRDVRRVATCLGFGPRFLHSTGQAYKGGPDTGVFLQITCEDAHDLPVPGQKYTFGVVKAAQARGDFEVLAQRGRRALRVHLGPDVGGGLRKLRELVEQALA
ncbi:MAG: bifunctional transaldolase/phosoglucose isomerase [Gemmatimonadota bacterium]|nr:MAG: bifunctional transaldolase/phosoglucose isomerase [Gemmatimonadota bacterium]